MSTADRTAEWLQSARIHQESAAHALEVKDVESRCLAEVVNVDSPRSLAAIEAVLKLTRDSSGDDLYPSIYVTVGEVREAITAALTKGEDGDGS